MFLKQIVLQGFKSFADRTEFTFHDGVTGIVGPNGCGKSNVLDAVRWVLGEQSAKSLRGSKMLDVVFSGSRSRKPANAAEVRLTFDNRAGHLATDDEEVTVGRTLYRSGDSEYQLNGKSCRLKDVRNLFLDTGVGVDAYSIIEQGRVDRLLQSSPIERREIFEEAAGISRYKVRRLEAQRKLERTQQNLLRLGDIVEELERRLRSVKLAAAKARKFQEYDAELREKRAVFSLAEYHTLEQSRQDLAQQLGAHRERLLQLRADLSARDAEAAERDHALQEQDERIRQADERLMALRTERSALAERVTQGEQRVAELREISVRRREQAGQVVARIADLQRQVGEDEQALTALSTELDRHRGRIDSLQEARDEVDEACRVARDALEQEKSAIFEAARQSSLLQNQITHLEQQQQRFTAQQQRLHARRDELTRELETLAEDRGRLESRQDELSRASATIAADERQAVDTIAGVETALTEARDRVDALRERRAEQLSRLQVLDDMDRRREGVGAAAREVLAWRDGPEPDENVLGLVADLLRVRDDRLHLLGALLTEIERSVVVRDAYAFFSTCDERSPLSGAVDLIALDRLPVSEPRDYRDAPGYLGCATDWVEASESLAPLARALFGRVILVDALERAMALAADAPEGYVFLTPEGARIGAGGRLSVGRDDGTGLMSRKAEILELREAVDELESNLGRVVREREGLEQESSELQVRRDELLSALARVQREHADATNGLQRVEDQRLRSQREAEAIAAELAGVGKNLAEIGQEATRLRDASRAAQEAQGSHESRITTLREQVDGLEQRVAGTAQQLTEALVEIGRITEQRSARERALDERRQAEAAAEKQRMAAENEAAQAADRIAGLEQEIAATRAQEQQRANACDEHERDVATLRADRLALRQQIESCGVQSRELHRQIEECEQQAHECDASQREVLVRRENLVARVQDELGLDLAGRYGQYEHTEQDWEAIREEIETLRGKIQRLGNVNLDSLTELEELTPRYESLIAQRDDLTASIARLEALIEELDTESHKRFESAFVLIRENFQELFRKLFGGGKADIVLEDPERPLECGIEIIARPPGKEPQSISLLSGGEKTMTCVALLMAVFKSKPSPFTILDEVDAALDEANVERFNLLLQEFLPVSQFVVITHNKKTMTHADVLYGITMEEPGVSKRVSVRFDDRVHTPHVA